MEIASGRGKHKGFNSAFSLVTSQMILLGSKFLREIRETWEMLKLVLKWTRKVRLNDAEKRAIKNQFIDIFKLLPLFIIFLLPFGSLILVLLIKILPLQILPTAFSNMPEID